MNCIRCFEEICRWAKHGPWPSKTKNIKQVRCNIFCEWYAKKGSQENKGENDLSWLELEAWSFRLEVKLEQKHGEMSRTFMGRKSVRVISGQTKAWRNERGGVLGKQWLDWRLADGILDQQRHCGKTRAFGIKRPLRGIIWTCLTFLNFSFLFYRMRIIICCSKDCCKVKIM